MLRKILVALDGSENAEKALPWVKQLAAREVAPGAGVKASFHVQRGDAAERILAFADANDLVVTTTHGAGGFKRWIFGSVAEKLIREASIPVLVYKTPTRG